MLVKIDVFIVIGNQDEGSSMKQNHVQDFKISFVFQRYKYLKISLKFRISYKCSLTKHQNADEINLNLSCKISDFKISKYLHGFLSDFTDGVQDFRAVGDPLSQEDYNEVCQTPGKVKLRKVP